MKNTIRKFTLLGFFVVSLCAGTLSVAKECVLLTQHKRIVEFVPDVECVTSSLSQLVLMLAQQVLNT